MTRWKTVLVVVLVCIATAAGGAYAVWRTHPPHFSTMGDHFRAAPSPVENADLTADLVDPPDSSTEHRTVTLLDAQTHFADNSAQATATVAVCVRPKGRAVFGITHEDPQRVCEAVYPVSDHPDFRWDTDARETVILTIAPTRRGSARVDGVDLTYTVDGPLGQRTGTDNLRVDLTASAS